MRRFIKGLRFSVIASKGSVVDIKRRHCFYEKCLQINWFHCPAIFIKWIWCGYYVCKPNEWQSLVKCPKYLPNFQHLAWVQRSLVVNMPSAFFCLMPVTNAQFTVQKCSLVELEFNHDHCEMSQASHKIPSITITNDNDVVALTFPYIGERANLVLLIWSFYKHLKILQNFCFPQYIYKNNKL